MNREDGIHLHALAPRAAPLALVRRRGAGHADALCDALAEAAMLAMARHLHERRGQPVPCAVDCAVLVAGQARPAPGGGAVYAPMQLHLHGHAPAGMDEIAVEAVRAWLRRHLPALDPQRHLRVHCHLSTETRAPATAAGTAGFGHAPLSPLERAVTAAANAVAGADVRTAVPAAAPDIEVLGTLEDGEPALHLWCTLVDAAVPAEAEAARALERLAARARDATGARREQVNHGVPPASALSVTGTRAECLMDGASGRSQAASGLLAAVREGGATHIAGRDIAHDPERRLSLGAGLLAAALVREHPAIEAASCRLLAAGADHGSQPPRVDIALRPAEALAPEALRGPVEATVRSLLARLPELWREQLGGALAIDGWPLDREEPDPLQADDAVAEARAGMLRAIEAGARETAAWTGREHLGERVMAAMASVPRQRFVPPERRAAAWQDRPLPIGEGQTISQPFVVALMCDLADVGPAARVLEVGSGCGYLAAVMSLLAGEVYGIERIATLADAAASRLRSLGYDNVHLRSGDGWAGWPEHAPFDAIIVSAASAQVPRALVRQLAPAGRLLLPLGGADSQVLTLVTPDGHGGWHEQAMLPVRFVPLLRGVE